MAPVWHDIDEKLAVYCRVYLSEMATLTCHAAGPSYNVIVAMVTLSFPPTPIYHPQGKVRTLSMCRPRIGDYVMWKD